MITINEISRLRQRGGEKMRWLLLDILCGMIDVGIVFTYVEFVEKKTRFLNILVIFLVMVVSAVGIFALIQFFLELIRFLTC